MVEVSKVSSNLYFKGVEDSLRVIDMRTAFLCYAEIDGMVVKTGWVHAEWQKLRDSWDKICLDDQRASRTGVLNPDAFEAKGIAEALAEKLIEQARAYREQKDDHGAFEKLYQSSWDRLKGLGYA